MPLARLELRGMGFKDGGEDVRDFRRAVADGQVIAGSAPCCSLSAVGRGSGAWQIRPATAKLAKGSEGGRRLRARDDAAAAAILAVADGPAAGAQAARRACTLGRVDGVAIHAMRTRAAGAGFACGCSTATGGAAGAVRALRPRECDHRQPVDKGGDPWSEGNLQCLCRGCHIAQDARREQARRSCPRRMGCACGGAHGPRGIRCGPGQGRPRPTPHTAEAASA